MSSPSNDPLHGITLAMMLEQLVEKLGWEEMARNVDIRCFTQDPSVSSSLKFLRKTPWARAKVERLYLDRIAAPPRSPRPRGPRNDGPR
ncbi:VF530 family DNA-binding protein [Planctomyces sp. SH-PL14]|jgi:uncharacterized protein (DUF2132 family)|uniref:VF530 family protein n=1 Tax=Planctomyces sp. SH-PL14 TaxID=1632864 RepID=UPI00078B7AED|nr:VF530 family protein [Planctomyces sp. SH-PL14]AMV22339.1 hypothetical protein VT03_30875 [Planctomyces sp. SH-PL14]